MNRERKDGWKTFWSLIALTGLISIIIAAGCQGGDELTLKEKINRFAPTPISADLFQLSEGDRKALAKIIEAARLFDPLFRRQLWSGNEALLDQLKADTTVTGAERLHYYRINQGPWSQLDDGEVFIAGAPEKPAAANFYPEDMTREEFETWLEGLNEKEREKATGFFYTIRRDDAGNLITVPYSEEYRDALAPVAELLREAAGLTTSPSLRKYLAARAGAFESNDYYASDIAWMELDAAIDLTIGPYETYEDGLFGYKAAFEAFVTLRDDEESAKLARFGSYLQSIEDNLPIDPAYRNPKLGAAAPMRVVNLVFSSGDANSGVQTVAFNLPNDARVIEAKGSKRVMLKNMQEAKFTQILTPIAGEILAEDQQGDISFDTFFTFILSHELMHGLGPHAITVNGRETSVRVELKELSSAMEEAKADISGLFALQLLIDSGELDAELERSLYPTFLAGAFRSVRFGIGAAHGRGMALQFNYLMDEGAITYDEGTGRFAVDPEKMKGAVRKLTGEIMTIQAQGSYEKARELLDKYGVIRPEMQKALDRLGGVPVDIEPIYSSPVE